MFAFRQNPVALKRTNWSFYVAQSYRIIEIPATDPTPIAYEISTTKYTYAISRTKDDKEFLAFHWDGKEDPHLHVGFAAKEMGALMDKKLHIPSGRVAVEQVVRFLINQVGAPERTKNALVAVAERLKIFWKHKSWS